MKHRILLNFTMALALCLPLIQACGSGEVSSERTDSPGEIFPFSKVSVSPAIGEVTTGETFDRVINIEGSDQTFYTAFDMTYDPTILEFVGAGEGTFLNRNGEDQTSFQVALQDGGAGRLTVGLTRLGQIGNVSGNGKLATLTFRALNPGTTVLTFTSPRGLKDSENTLQPVDAWENAVVTVN